MLYPDKDQNIRTGTLGMNFYTQYRQKCYYKNCNELDSLSKIKKRKMKINLPSHVVVKVANVVSGQEAKHSDWYSRYGL